MKKMKICVTGGSGFIGTHLCRELSRLGHTVEVLDLVPPQYPVTGVKYTIGDVRDMAAVRTRVKDVDAVYHFAAIVSVPVCQQMPLESYRTNFWGTLQVLEALKEKQALTGKKTRLLFAGSAAVYGALGEIGAAHTEDRLLDQPLSFYGAQKLGSEQAIRLYFAEAGIPSVIFRFFNVFGPGQDPSSPYSGVISIFSKKIHEGSPLQLFSGGVQTRDFISVHDLVRACAKGLSVPDALASGLVLNLGTGQSVSVRELAHLMMKVSGKSVPIIDAPPRDGDVLHSLADHRRAHTLLEWSPQVSLAEGLDELLGREK